MQSLCHPAIIHNPGNSRLEIKRKVDELIIRGAATQFSDSAYREELGYWIGQGVFGTPWRISKIAQFAVTYMNINKGQAKKDFEVPMRNGKKGSITNWKMRLNELRSYFLSEELQTTKIFRIKNEKLEVIDSILCYRL
jgi:hypothetical protein